MCKGRGVLCAVFIGREGVDGIKVSGARSVVCIGKERLVWKMRVCVHMTSWCNWLIA